MADLPWPKEPIGGPSTPDQTWKRYPLGDGLESGTSTGDDGPASRSFGRDRRTSRGPFRSAPAMKALRSRGRSDEDRPTGNARLVPLGSRTAPGRAVGRGLGSSCPPRQSISRRSTTPCAVSRRPDHDGVPRKPRRDDVSGELLLEASIGNPVCRLLMATTIERPTARGAHAERGG